MKNYIPKNKLLGNELGRAATPAALKEYNEKRLTGYDNKTVSKMDVAAAKGRDIIANSMFYKVRPDYRYENGKGDVVNTMTEANKLNDEIAKFAPGDEGAKFEAEFKASKKRAYGILNPTQKQKDDKLLRYVDDISKGDYKKYEKDEENYFSKILPNLKKSKKAGTPFESYNKEMNDIDLLFSAADPKEKMEMRKNYKTYDFTKRKFKEDIAKEQILKTPITKPVAATPKPVEVPSVDVGELIKQRADNRAAMEKAQSLKDYGAHGLGHLRLQMQGLDD